MGMQFVQNLSKVARMKKALDDALSSVIRRFFGGALGKRPSKVDGEVRTRGTSGEIVIHREIHGVPSIVAANEMDAYFGLGFCHGQDRAGQLEILIRTVRGTLSEIAGPEALPIDRLARRIGFRRVGRGQLAAARPEVREQIEAYARGVNAGTHLGGPRAHDLVLFGCDPTPFEPEDSQGLMVSSSRRSAPTSAVSGRVIASSPAKNDSKPFT